MGVLVLVIGLVCLALMCLRGIPVIFASLVSAGVILLLSGADIYQGYMTNFAGGLAGFVTKFFLLFVLGALFGKLVEISGATETIARTIVGKFGEKYVMIGIILTAAVLCYGGVSVYVALFALYPLAMGLFKKADIPRRLFAGAYMAGGGTFAMTSPFTPSVQNVIPTGYLGTTVGALPVHGIIVSLFTAAFAIWWMQLATKKAKLSGEHFIPLDSDIEIPEDTKRPNFLLSLIPLIVLIVVLNVFKFTIEASLFAGIIAALLCYFPYIPKNMPVLWKHTSVATSDGINAIMNTSATVGFGTVIAKSEAFAELVPMLTGLEISPLIMAAIMVTVLAGMAGSASGGLGIAVPITAQIFLPMGVDADALHRVAAVSSSGLDSLPHNGAVVTFLNYSKTTHKEGYFNIFMVSVVGTVISMGILLVLLAVTGYM